MNTATTEQKRTVQELRESLAGAQTRQRELAQEAAELPQRLRDASRQAARQRADAARNGEAGDGLATVAADLDIRELQDREATIPFDLWASRLTVLEIARDLAAAELEEAEAEVRLTGPKYEKAQRELAMAEKAHADSYSAHSAAANRAQGLRLKLRDAEREIGQLEESHPNG